MKKYIVLILLSLSSTSMASNLKDVKKMEVKDGEQMIHLDPREWLGFENIPKVIDRIKVREGIVKKEIRSEKKH